MRVRSPRTVILTAQSDRAVFFQILAEQIVFGCTAAVVSDVGICLLKFVLSCPRYSLQ